MIGYFWYRKQIEKRDVELAELRAALQCMEDRHQSIKESTRSAIERRDDRIEELEAQLTDAESQARQAEAKLFAANNSLASATANLAAEQHARKQAERTLSEQLSRAQAAIDTLQGRI